MRRVRWGSLSRRTQAIAPLDGLNRPASRSSPTTRATRRSATLRRLRRPAIGEEPPPHVLHHPAVGAATWPPARTYRPVARPPCAGSFRMVLEQHDVEIEADDSGQISTSDPSASILMMCASGAPPALASRRPRSSSSAHPGRRSSPRRNCSCPGTVASGRDRRWRRGRARPTSPGDATGCSGASRNSRGAARSSGVGIPASERQPAARTNRCSRRCRGSPGRGAHRRGRIRPEALSERASASRVGRSCASPFRSGLTAPRRAMGPPRGGRAP